MPEFLPGQPLLAGSQVLLLWTPVPGATSYAVYHNGTREAVVGANQHLAAAPKDPGEHKYQVAAIDATGAEGERSAPGTAKWIALFTTLAGVAWLSLIAY